MYSSDSEIKKRKITLILAAAGIGKRMGLDYPKQFFEHNGKPLFIFPLEIAEKSSLIDEIIIVTNENNIDSNIFKKFLQEEKNVRILFIML